MIELDLEQRSADWFNARQGSVTGTRLCKAVGSPKVQETFMYELISERMTEAQISTFDSEAMSRGRDMEHFAIAAVAEKTGLDFEECGMMKSELQEWFAISPDAVIRDGGKIIGGLETKAPNSATHVKYMCADGVPKEYRHQVLAPFVVSDDVEFWYFSSFDDRNYMRPLFTIKVERKDVAEEIEKIRDDLKKFLDKVDETYTGLIF